ncbi:unnamed protein product [Protopolystoma xenopodis]|uniref:Bromo domain-containing protein n=1 Tax=Protopolystoma xenopodis TaxID=117903 RepID=A0A3S5B1I9_9PLAT|nr:unnamed protein product [Protopolystoma xenopodis]
MCSYVVEEFCHKEMKLMRLESLVNPLLDENDLVGLSYLLTQAVDAMRAVENSRPFHFPVDKKRYPVSRMLIFIFIYPLSHYYKKIQRPLDLSTLERLVKENRYHSRDEFFVDADLLVSNCIAFNGADSPLTTVATRMLDAAHSRLKESKETLDTIEANIKRFDINNDLLQITFIFFKFVSFILLVFFDGYHKHLHPLFM